jgi:hypothetical protein
VAGVQMPGTRNWLQVKVQIWPESSGVVCWRIFAKVLRFQIATAIPPNTAEVAIKRPERQTFRRSGTEKPSSGASGKDVETRSKRNLRSGMDDPDKKKCKKSVRRETNFPELRLCWGRVKLSPRNTVIGIWNFKKYVF